jgi:hypothetical protein
MYLKSPAFYSSISNIRWVLSTPGVLRKKFN